MDKHDIPPRVDHADTPEPWQQAARDDELIEAASAEMAWALGVLAAMGLGLVLSWVLA